MKFSPKSISTKLSLIVAPTVILGFLASTLVTEYYSSKHFSQSVLKELTKDAHRIAEVIKSDTEARFVDLDLTLSNSELEKGLLSEDYALTFLTLAKLKQTLKVYSGLEVYDRSGRLVASSSPTHFEFLTKNGEVNAKNQPWFKEAMLVKGFSKNHKSDIYNTNVFSFYSPIKGEKNKKTLGALRLVYNAAHLFGAVQDHERFTYQLGNKTRRYIVIDDQGTIIYHPQAKFIFKNNLEFNPENFKKPLPNNPAFWDSNSNSDQSFSFSTIKVSENVNWTVLALQNSDETLASVRQLSKILLLMALLVSILVVASIVFANQIITRPLSDFSESIYRLIKSKNYSEKLAAPNNVEVQKITIAFNELLTDLQRSTVSKHFIDSIFMGLSDLVIALDNSGRILFTNDNVSSFLGYSPEELKNQPINNLFNDDSLKDVESIKGLIALGEMNELDSNLFNKKRESKPILLTGNYLHDDSGKLIGLLLTAKDALESRITREFEAQKSLFESVIHNMGEGLVVADRLGKGLILNLRAKEILGLKGVLPEPAWEKAREILTTCSEIDGTCLSIFNRTLSGEFIDNLEISFKIDELNKYINCSSRPIKDSNGKVTAAIIVFRDVTHVREAQSELESTRGQLVQSEKMAVLGVMAGGIAHEINNPVAVIKGASEFMLELLEDDDLDKETSVEMLEKIKNTSMRISKIVKGLKTISRDGTSDPFVPAPVSEIIEDTLVFAKDKFVNQNIELTIEPSLEELQSLKLHCRASQLSQVILNFMSNAADAIEECPDLEEKWVKVLVDEMPNEVVISVVDSGPGVPEHLVEKINLPFFTTKEVGKGTGLGLSISRSIVEEHHGRMEYHDIGNTTFSIYIPKAVEKTNDDSGPEVSLEAS